jgi:hypothetical protein
MAKIKAKNFDDGDKPPKKAGPTKPPKPDKPKPLPPDRTTRSGRKK